jgi:hypothetical protein
VLDLIYFRHEISFEKEGFKIEQASGRQAGKTNIRM